MLGKNEKMGPLINQQTGKGSHPDWLALLNQAIALEFDGKTVGPPVDVILITKKGAKWMQKKALCPEIRPS